jgi:hypothetical protein
VSSNRCDILIAIPHSGLGVGMEWAISFASLWKHAPPNTRLLIPPEPQIDVARNKTAEVALKVGAGHVFFLDSDIHPPRDVIHRLLAHHLPIVSALYARRQNPPNNQMLRRTPDSQKFVPIEEGAYKPGSLVECDAVGFGCALVEARVFRSIERPWFRWTEYYTPDGTSEDFDFCVKAKKAGFPIFVDTSIVCSHSGLIKWVPSKTLNRFEYTQLSGVFSD